MATLADDYLARGRAPTGPDLRSHLALAQAHERLLEHLRLSSVSSAKETAERFAFEVDPTSIVGPLVKSGSVTVEAIFSSLIVPCLPCWIEMPITFDTGRRGRVGYMLEEFASGRVLVTYVSDDEDRQPWLCAVVSLDRMPWRPAQEAVVHGICVYKKREDLEREMKMIIRDVVDALFLLSVPRVCELRESAHAPKLQRARVRRGKLPLLEIKRVTVLIGEAAPRYAREPGAGGSDGEKERRRYHRVVNFLRTYRKGRDEPRVAFVPGHWRGDPARGVVIRERRIKEKRT